MILRHEYPTQAYVVDTNKCEEFITRRLEKHVYNVLSRSADFS